MKKSVWIFLLAVFLPGAVLGWLALRGVEEQQIVFERRTAELYQKEAEALSSSVRDAIEGERRNFGDAVHRLLAQNKPGELARDFTNSLADVWPRKVIGFALSDEGAMLSPNAKDAANPEWSKFIFNNGPWLCNAQPAKVYIPRPEIAGKYGTSNTLAYQGNFNGRLAQNAQNASPQQQAQQQAQQAPLGQSREPATDYAMAQMAQNSAELRKDLFDASKVKQSDAQERDNKPKDENPTAPFRGMEEKPQPKPSTGASPALPKTRAMEAAKVPEALKTAEASTVNRQSSTRQARIETASPEPAPMPPSEAASKLSTSVPDAPIAPAAPSQDAAAFYEKDLPSAEADPIKFGRTESGMWRYAEGKAPWDYFDSWSSYYFVTPPYTDEYSVRGDGLAGAAPSTNTKGVDSLGRVLENIDRYRMAARSETPRGRGSSEAGHPAATPLLQDALSDVDDLSAGVAAQKKKALAGDLAPQAAARPSDPSMGELAPLNPAPAPAPTIAPAEGLTRSKDHAAPIAPQKPAAAADVARRAGAGNKTSLGVPPGRPLSPEVKADKGKTAMGNLSFDAPTEGKRVELQRAQKQPAPKQAAGGGALAADNIDNNSVSIHTTLPSADGKELRLTVGPKGQPMKRVIVASPTAPVPPPPAPAPALPTPAEPAASTGVTAGQKFGSVSTERFSKSISEERLAEKETIEKAEKALVKEPLRIEQQVIPPTVQQLQQQTGSAWSVSGDADSAGSVVRNVAPQQVINSPSQAVSSLMPDTAAFGTITSLSDEGMVARFVQDKLEIIFWVRPPEDRSLVFGCMFEAATLSDLWSGLFEHRQPLINGTNPPYVLALLDDKAKPVAAQPANGGSREWKHPFVASEIGEVLPHWEAALYLASPGAIAESASGFRRTLSFTVAAALAIILIGAWLVVADIRRELALAQQKTDFVSNVSHELKTPLTSIRMFAELMHDRPPPVEKQGQYLRIITVEAERLTRLINNVLDFAKLERRQKQFDKRTLDLHAVIERVWDCQEMHLRDAGFTTGWKAAPAPYPVLGDEDALSQVLVNLLSNAEKYSQEKKEVELHTWTEDGWLHVSVLDRGMGVPSGEERKIFESFYRAHDSLSSGIQGSGLGLTLAQRLAQEHGGRIEFSRREGGGSRFTLMLPLIEQPAEEKA